MKFCLHCGKEIEDNVEVCPYCREKVSTKSELLIGSKSEVSYKSKTNNEISSTTKILIFVFGLMFEMTGLVLFAIYGIKELRFNLDYDLSELSDAGIDVVRELTGNNLNVTLIFVGLALAVLGILILNAQKIIKYIK